MIPTPGVQRIWRLSRGPQECIGAIIEGYVEGITEPGATGYVAFVSVMTSGEFTRRMAPDGRVFHVAQWEDGTNERFGAHADTLPEAMQELETLKAALIGEGWHEVSLDSVNDPD